MIMREDAKRERKIESLHTAQSLSPMVLRLFHSSASFALGALLTTPPRLVFCLAIGEGQDSYDPLTPVLEPRMSYDLWGLSHWFSQNPSVVSLMFLWLLLSATNLILVLPPPFLLCLKPLMEDYSLVYQALDTDKKTICAWKSPSGR